MQQPVPARFCAENGDDQAYFEWLRREIEKIREPFLEQITSTVQMLNKANWPTDLGLLLGLGVTGTGGACIGIPVIQTSEGIFSSLSKPILTIGFDTDDSNFRKFHW